MRVGGLLFVPHTSVHQQDDSSTGCGFLESLGSVTQIMLWNLVNLIGADGLWAKSMLLFVHLSKTAVCVMIVA